MVNDNTIPLSIPVSEFRLPLSVSLVSPKSEMLLSGSRPRVVVSMVLSEDKTEIIETEEILYDDFDEETEMPIIKQENDCTITSVTYKPPNDHPTLKSEVGITQELVVNIARANLEKLSEDTKSRKRNRSSSVSSSRRDEEDDKHQIERKKRGRPSKKGHKLGQRTLYCTQCGYETSKLSHFKRHISIVHKKGEGLKKHSCSKCTYQAFDKQQLAQHIRCHDGVKVKYHRCSRCGYITYRKNGLKDHVCDKQLLTCYDCGYQTVLKKNLRNHVSCHSHTENLAFNCHVCSFSTTYKHSLKLHMFRHNTNLEGFRKYKCSKCDYQSCRKDYLKKHALVHMTDKYVPRYDCHHCDYRTRRKDSLKIHGLVHMTDKDVTTYSCNQCDFQTRRKSSLKRHGLVHMADRDGLTYSCKHCDFRTHQKYHLKRHVLQHNKRAYEVVKTLKCSECDFQSVYKNSLKRHLLRHKKREEIPMESVTDLNRHKRTHNLE